MILIHHYPDADSSKRVMPVHSFIKGFRFNDNSRPNAVEFDVKDLRQLINNRNAEQIKQFLVELTWVMEP